jgi:hypothetical protein
MVRTWTRLYTVGLEPGTRSERRAEIDSDLWEHRHHLAADRQSSRMLSLAIWGRWAAGIPADLSWRAGQRRNHHSQRKELAVTNPIGRNWWQTLSVLAALGSGYLGVQQFVSDDVTAAITPGKAGGLVVFLGGGLLVLLGLAMFSRYPRRGAGLVMAGVVPTAVIGGLGLGTVLGLIISVVGSEGWWWMPTAIISTIATAAGIGAFSAWWNAGPAGVDSHWRTVLLPAVTILAGLLAGFAGLGMGLSLLGLAGVVVFGLGLVFWARRVRSAT